MSHSPDLMKPLRSLVEMGEREELEMRPVLLHVLTDLFVSRPSHSFAEIKQFEAITLGLMDFAGDRTRLTMAGKLARFGATPASVFASGSPSPNSAAQSQGPVSSIQSLSSG